jgi:hypothetical protein
MNGWVDHRFRELAQNRDNQLVVEELNERWAENEAQICKAARQLHEIKIPFTRRVRLFSMGYG